MVKLLRDPVRLEILGSGTPAKPYIALGDLVAGMRHAVATILAPRLTILNVGPEGTVTVRRVAELVADALALPAGSVEFSFTAGQAKGGGWPGDTALVDFDTSALRSLGWAPSMSGEEAIRTAATGIAARYRERNLPLVTSMERRRAADALVAIEA